MLYTNIEFIAYVDQDGIIWAEDHHTGLLRLGNRHDIDLLERKSGYWKNSQLPLAQSIISIKETCLELLLRDRRVVRLTDGSTDTVAKNVLSADRFNHHLLIVTIDHQLFVDDRMIATDIKQVMVIPGGYSALLLTTDNHLKMLAINDRLVASLNLPPIISARIDRSDKIATITIITDNHQVWIYNNRNELSRCAYRQPNKVIDSWAYYSIDNQGRLWDMRIPKIINDGHFVRFELREREVNHCNVIDKDGNNHLLAYYNNHGCPYWPFNDGKSPLESSEDDGGCLII